MGQSQLRELAHIEEVSPDAFHGSTVAVDAYQWIHTYMHPTAHIFPEEQYTANGTNYSHLLGAIRGIPRFIEHDIIPIFVFDGVAHNLKADEQQTRQNAREERLEQAEAELESGNIEKARRLKAQAESLTSDRAKDIKEFFNQVGIPYITAPGAGEAQVAYMTREDSGIDYGLSDDYDALLFGADQTIRSFSGDGNPEVMHFDRTLDKHGLTHRQLVDVGIMLGTDYNDGVPYVGPKRGLKWIQEHESIHGVLDAKEKSVDAEVETIRQLFLSDDYIDEYTVPDAVHLNPDEGLEYVVSDVGLDTDRVHTEFNRIATQL